MRTEIVSATPELVSRYYQGPVGRTVRAVAALQGEDVIGIAGVYPGASGWVLFGDLSDAIRADKRALVKMYRRVMQLMERRPMVALSLADPEIEGSDILLEHMGFRRAQGDIFVWHN